VVQLFTHTLKDRVLQQSNFESADALFATSSAASGDFFSTLVTEQPFKPSVQPFDIPAQNEAVERSSHGHENEVVDETSFSHSVPFSHNGPSTSSTAWAVTNDSWALPPRPDNANVPNQHHDYNQASIPTHTGAYSGSSQAYARQSISYTSEYPPSANDAAIAPVSNVSREYSYVEPTTSTWTAPVTNDPYSNSYYPEEAFTDYDYQSIHEGSRSVPPPETSWVHQSPKSEDIIEDLDDLMRSTSISQNGAVVGMNLCDQ
jgi:hypothetical protein